ncbi:hypothetical protein [Variovorax rhizosphaerae]|uniref:AsmA-like C-terminal domain-containing protein n=1 Tax=Variovorax rhizosphaerae TaxID=1836200 RepID=A0ABU8WPV6_9BURK
MAFDTDTSWFPLFEFQDWVYQSFLLLPSPEKAAATPEAEVSARKWSRGSLVCGQAFRDAGRYTLTGRLIFSKGLELAVSASGALGSGDEACTFQATGTGVAGPLKGMISRLAGWVFPEVPILNGGGRVLSVRGSTWAVRGTDINPTIDPSGMPLGTVGQFVITRAATAADGSH